MDESRERIPLERLDAYRWRIPVSYQPGMRVPGMVFADDALINDIREENALRQVANVATLPGIVGNSLGMPDIHWGYGFPVGGVAATDADAGVEVSPVLTDDDLARVHQLTAVTLDAKALGLRVTAVAAG